MSAAPRDVAYLPPLLTTGVPRSLPGTQAAAVSGPSQNKNDDNHISRSGTSSLNAVCRLNVAELPPDVVFGDGAVLQGDVTHFSLERFICIGPAAVVRAPLRILLNQPEAVPVPSVRIGSFTTIGSKSVCAAVHIGGWVRIADCCVIGEGATVADGVWLQPQSVVPAEIVLAPFTVYAGSPVVPIGKLNAHAYRAQQMEYVRECLGL